MTCVNSSRELLNRYIRLRCIRVSPFCCRMIDFAAFTSCMALLCAHISRHQQSDRTDYLAHQHLSDRAMIKETIELMLHTSRTEMDPSVLQRTVMILECLSVIEVDSAMVTDQTTSLEVLPPNREHTRSIVRLKVPFLGPVTISASGFDLECLHDHPASTRHRVTWTQEMDLLLTPAVDFDQ
ncbi:hypothetical protein GGS24DRAFT_478033 [Hypoxylon argillaceum]|nr:hypothetical protein GGS24DRAFT_478033 [Hypoxylon argillaceum]